MVNKFKIKSDKCRAGNKLIPKAESRIYKTPPKNKLIIIIVLINTTLINYKNIFIIFYSVKKLKTLKIKKKN